MSITYPEVKPSSASTPGASKPAAANIMNSGSALFPGGSTEVYERASKARSGGNMSLAWIAAPVAVVLIGGAVYLATAHRPTASQTVAPAAPTQTVSSSTTTTQVPTTQAPPPALAVQPAVPAADTTRHVVTHTRIVEAPAAPVERVEHVRAAAAPVHVARTRVTRTETAPSQAASAEAPAPVMAAPAQAVTPAATPGSFALTPAPEAAPEATPSVAPTTTDAAPAAPSGDKPQ